jgi:hypothetical protein
MDDRQSGHAVPSDNPDFRMAPLAGAHRDD